MARHFLTLDSLQRVVDGMALLKLNVLHLHLTDDQGFRFGSERFPRLPSTAHYTKQQLRQLVAYAADRGVRIVPELDVPGHVTSWLTAYPEWGLHPVRATNRYGVHRACLDPTKDSVYDALAELLAEVADVFPDRYLHLGGDEVHPQWWSDDSGVGALMQREQLADVAAVQNYFMQRMVDILDTIERTAIGWDEVLHPQMPQMVVQNWRGASTRDRARHQGLPCIVSSPFYLDLMYPADFHYVDIAAEQSELLALEDEQRADPRLAHVAQGIEWTLQWRAHALHNQTLSGPILGGEACLWSELVDEQTWPVRLWSRVPVIAECLWREPEVSSVTARLGNALELLDVSQLSQTQLRAIGLDDAQAEMAMWLEPVKWYARLLGETALQARLAGREMPQARPYQTDTALNKVVDFLPPAESCAAQLAG